MDMFLFDLDGDGTVDMGLLAATGTEHSALQYAACNGALVLAAKTGGDDTDPTVSNFDGQSDADGVITATFGYAGKARSVPQNANDTMGILSFDEVNAFENGVAGALAEINTTLKGAVDDSTAKGGTDVAMEELILLFDEADAFHFVETTPEEFAKLIEQAAIIFPDFYVENDPEVVSNDAGGLMIIFPDYYVENDPEIVSDEAGGLTIHFDFA